MNEKITNINQINDQFTFYELTQNRDNSSELKQKERKRMRRNFRASEEDLRRMKELSDKGLTQEEIANELKIGRNFFYQTRNNPKHPQHKIMIELFGPIGRRPREVEEIELIDQSKIINNSIQETFNNLSRLFVCEFIMHSDNSQINAEDKAIALKYKNLQESLKDALRLEDKSDPMYLHAKALYDIITSQLIEVTRKIYDEREQNQSSKKP